MLTRLAFITTLFVASIPHVLAQAPPSKTEAEQLQSILNTRAASIVTVRVIFEIEARGTKREFRRDLLGTIVDASGLIMVANHDINPEFPADPRMGPIKITPVSLKIVLGKETKEHESFIAAKDTKYGLAFVQMKEPGDAKLSPIKFDAKRELVMGQEIVSVGRMGRGYDYAPYCTLARISGSIKKPRKAMISAGEILAALPCFTMDGRVAGVHVPIKSGDESGGLGGPVRTPLFLIEPKIVGGEIKQSLKQAATMLEDQKKEAAEEQKNKFAPKVDPEKKAAKKVKEKVEGTEGGR